MDVAARHHLAVVSGPGVGWVLPLAGGAVVVGRGAGADLVLVDPQLSRKHLQVRDRGGRVRLRDLGLVTLVALGASLLASALPARTAARTSPAAALAVD